MEILLAYKAHAGGAHDPFTSLLPIGLGSMNAYLRGRGFRTRIANFSKFEWVDIERLLAVEAPVILGISQFTHNRRDTLRLALLAKKLNPSCFVVLGGPHATHLSQELLTEYDSLDAIVLGEGEETFCELAQCLLRNGGKGFEAVRGIAFRRGTSLVVNPPRAPLMDLDSLPFPAVGIDDAIGVEQHLQSEFLITSRGCPASCSFCSSPRFWGRSLRFRSPSSIVDEIIYIRDHYGLIYFSIRDDTFTADRKRVLEFCQLLLVEKVFILWNCQSRVNAVDEEILTWMKRAGCECIQFGVESGSVRVLRKLGKGITPEQIRRAAAGVRRVGMHLSLYLMTGVPDENEADLKETLELLEEVRASDGQVSPLVYYPGTALFAEGVKCGAVQADLFNTTGREACYVRSDAFVKNSTRELLARIEQVAAKTRYVEADFIAQKKELGYCHAINIMAGEMYEAEAKWRKAETEYREITVREPENPWGWLMIGEMYGRRGYVNKARQAFEKLAELVPAHQLDLPCLGELHGKKL